MSGPRTATRTTLTTYSFSKWLGLAGLRLGAIAGPPGLLGRLTMVPSNPLGASIVAQRAAIAGLKVKEACLRGLRQVNRRNQEIVTQAVERGPFGRVLVAPSHGNFLAVDIAGHGWTADQVCAALLERDVFIRSGTYQSPAFGGEFQEAARAAQALPDDFVHRMALAGGSAEARQHIRNLAGLGIESVTVFPLGAQRMRTVELFRECVALEEKP